METEEDDNSNPSLLLENDTTMTLPTTTETDTTKDLLYVEPQCGPHPLAELPQLELGGGDGELQTPPPEIDTKVPDKSEYQDVVAGENTSGEEVSKLEVGGGGSESQSPPSRSPQIVVEGGDDESQSAKAEEETEGIESGQAEEEIEGIEASEILQEVPGKEEVDGYLIPGQGAHAVIKNSDLLSSKGNDGDINAQVENSYAVVGAGVDVLEVNKETETKMEVVAEVADDTEILAEADVTAEGTATDGEMKKRDVAEETTAAADTAEEAVMADIAEDTVKVEEEEEVEMADIAEDTAEVEEVKEEKEEEVEEVKEEKEEETEEVQEEKEEEVVLAEEMDMAEQTEVTDGEKEKETNAAEETEDIVSEAGEMDGTEMANRSEEKDNDEDVDAANVGEEEVEMAEEADNAEDMELADGTEGAGDEVEEVSRSAGGKRKRGKAAKAPTRASSRKKVEEDVCFICFDGGDLVLCDRRGCPKAYHPSCVNRDEAFFRAKGRWNCGFMYTTTKLAGVDLCERTGSSCPAHSLSFASSPSGLLCVIWGVTLSPMIYVHELSKVPMPIANSSNICFQAKVAKL